MGAGRKTETYTLAQSQDGQYGSGHGNCMRNLKKGDLCGVIFGCKFSTIKECFAKKLFGLPAQHMAYIKNIDPGLTLFLFNYSDRTLHGIFEAASKGEMNIDPIAWSPNGTDPSPFPAQVKIRVRVQCKPLVEEKFGPVIAENYSDTDENMFWFELDRGQTNKLLRLFSPSPSVRVPLPKKGIPASSLAEIGNSGATRVNKWSSLFKSSDDSGENKEKDSKEGSRLVNLGRTRAAGDNAEERKDQPSVPQSGPSYSSVLRNKTDSLTLPNAFPSLESKGVENPWTSASGATSLHQDTSGFRNTSKEGKEVKVNAYPQQIPPTSAIAKNVIGATSKEEDAYSDLDWDSSSSFKVHLEGLNRILEEPTGNEGFKRFEGSSSMVPNHWEDEIEKNTGDFQERHIDKSPCGSSYVSAITGDAVDDFGDDREKHRVDNFKLDMGCSVFVDVLNEIFMEVKELKHVQMKQADRMISLEMELLESRREILRLKGMNATF